MKEVMSYEEFLKEVKKGILTPSGNCPLTLLLIMLQGNGKIKRARSHACVSGSGKSSLTLRQRPGVPGIRSTFGTGTELLNSLRLMFSRLASHR